MTYLVNPHVERLARHLPFGANASELYEESVVPDDGRPAIQTRALSYVRDLLAKPETSLIVLTGDAGHGKTHLCRRVLELEYGYGAIEALDLIKRTTDGVSAITSRDGSPRRPLRVIRDLSGIEPAATGADRMAELLADHASIGIVCANEGRLRDAISHGRHPELRVVLDTLEQSVSEGVTSIRPDVHVVNLNWQSVTSPTNSFVAQLLEDWVADRRRWATCRGCEAALRCSILANQAALGGTDQRDQVAARRRAGIEQLLRMLEQAGYVLTIREVLMLVAYTVTAGMDCKKVAQADRRPGAQTGVAHDFVWALYESALGHAERLQLPVLDRLRRFDPGEHAIPRVDGALVRVLDRQDVLEGSARTSPPPRTVREARSFAENFRRRIRRLRRQDFFDGEAVGRREDSPLDAEGERAYRVGLRHYRDFASIFVSGTDTKDVRNRLVDGLHVLQGLRPAPGLYFFMADPAFARAEGRAPIIARRFLRSSVKVMPLEVCWARTDLTRAVDWTPRRVALQFGDEPHRLELDLLQFELVARAAGGVVARRFFAAESRRILARLATIVGTGPPADGIQVMDGERLRLIAIDNDVFVVGDP